MPYKSIAFYILGGDSKTLMIVQVSPVEKNVGETVASLSFAQRVRSVELGSATKRTEGAEIVELKEKIAQYEVNIYVSFCLFLIFLHIRLTLYINQAFVGMLKIFTIFLFN